MRPFPVDDGSTDAPRIGRIGRIFARTVLLTALAGIGLVIGGLRGDAFQTVLGFAFYVFAAIAIKLEANETGARLPPHHDVALDKRRGYQLAGASVATFIASIAGLYLALVVLSWPFEEWVVRTFLGPDDEPALPGGTLLRAVHAIETVALGPAVEEVLFRGLMLHWWARRWGVRRAVVTSALLFGALHLDPLGSTLFALVATALYMSFGTLLAPIVFHAMWNCSVTVLTAFSQPGAPEAESIASFRSSWPWALGALVAALGLLHATLRSLRPVEGWVLPSQRR